jgi:uncharacterized protein YbaA (DUF1428 family)
MSKYVDGFVLPLPSDKIDAYRDLATVAAEVWIEHGALEYVECAADDLNTEMRSFSEVAGARENETVILAYIVYRSREHRDEVNQRVMADPRLAGMCGSGDMPFEPKRMGYGGFRVLVEAGMRPR